MKVVFEAHRKSDGARVEVKTYKDMPDMLETIRHQATDHYYLEVHTWVHNGMPVPLVLDNGPDHIETYTAHANDASV